MKKNKMGKYSETAREAGAREVEKEKEEEARGKTFKVNDRCEVSLKNIPKQRGVIMYLGLFFYFFQKLFGLFNKILKIL